jgi:K+-sensing histidine kinase KdpD
MKNIRYSTRLKLLFNSIFAMLSVAAVTVPLYLIGRDALGEGVIALLYLLPIAWSTSRWGLIPGIVAAITATLCFDFLFIPPYNTFVVGNLEGWLVLAIFLTVAIVVVDRIQASLFKARQATFMYEFSTALSSQRTLEAIAITAAQQIQQLYLAKLVNITYRSVNPPESNIASYPPDSEGEGKPDHILPILTNMGLVGEIQIWSGPYMELTPEDIHLVQNFSSQLARAFERAQPLGAGYTTNNLAFNTRTK